MHDNVLTVDFTAATVLFIYLVPDGMKKLCNKLVAAIARGVRIATYGNVAVVVIIIISYKHLVAVIKTIFSCRF